MVISQNSAGYNAILAAMIGATLQDLKKPDHYQDDPLPSDKNGEDFQAWMDRHTVKQRKTNQNDGSFLGDDLYNHYTAKAILNGAPFNAMGHKLTLKDALSHLGILNPSKKIEDWINDPVAAAETGDRLIAAINNPSSYPEKGIEEGIATLKSSDFVLKPEEFFDYHEEAEKVENDFSACSVLHQ